MYHRILVPLDGSPVAEQVLPIVRTLAALSASSVILLQTIESVHNRLRVDGEVIGPEDQAEPQRASALAYLEGIRRDFSAGHIQSECHIRRGPAAAAILATTEVVHADLIAMVTHGRTGLQQWVYGSVADKVIAGARLPILLVRARETPSPPAPIRRILVPLDGSELAERALVPAEEFANAFGAEVVLVRVWGHWAYTLDSYPSGVSMIMLDDQIRGEAEEYLTRTSSALGSRGVRVRCGVLSGPVAERILEMAAKHRADWIVMSTHGRTGVGRWVMGSVADRVLRASPIPVLLMRAGVVIQ